METNPFAEACGESTIHWHLLSDEDKRFGGLIAQRAAQMVRDFRARNPQLRDVVLDPDTMLIAMDVLAVHLTRGLSLYGLLLAPDDLFWSDIVTITKNIDRSCGRIPDGVKLYFDRQRSLF